MENIIKQRIDEMKNTKFPNGFSNGIDGFLEAVSFFNEQENAVHEDEDPKIRFAICGFFNTLTFKQIDEMNLLLPFMCQLAKKGLLKKLCVHSSIIKKMKELGIEITKAHKILKTDCMYSEGMEMES